MRVLIVTVFAVLVSFQASATGGSVYCLGVEIPDQNVQGDKAVSAMLEACAYRVARARAALNGHLGAKATGIKYVDTMYGDASKGEDPSWYSRVYEVTIESNKGTSTETVNLEGSFYTVPNADDVEYYINNAEATLNIELNQ